MDSPEQSAPAPNDQLVDPIVDSKLSPEQQALTQAAEFREWFAGSKMVDAQTGEPQVWYHGTNRPFDEIKHPKDIGKFSNFGLDHDYEGIYLTDDPERAVQYADPLGTNFNAVMLRFAKHSESTNGVDAVNNWNDFVQACVNRDGRVLVANSAQPDDSDRRVISLDEVEGAAMEGGGFGTGFVLFDGKIIGLVDELRHEFGGELPRPDDQLVPYNSLVGSTRAFVEKLAARGLQPLVPHRAEPRILPYFVHAEQPQELSTENGSPTAADHLFAQGVEARREDPSIDAVVAKGDPLMHGNNLLVFDAEQLCPAA